MQSKIMRSLKSIDDMTKILEKKIDNKNNRPKEFHILELPGTNLKFLLNTLKEMKDKFKISAENISYKKFKFCNWNKKGHWEHSGYI